MLVWRTRLLQWNKLLKCLRNWLNMTSIKYETDYTSSHEMMDVCSLTLGLLHQLVE